MPWDAASILRILRGQAASAQPGPTGQVLGHSPWSNQLHHLSLEFQRLRHPEFRHPRHLRLEPKGVFATPGQLRPSTSANSAAFPMALGRAGTPARSTTRHQSGLLLGAGPCTSLPRPAGLHVGSVKRRRFPSSPADRHQRPVTTIPASAQNGPFPRPPPNRLGTSGRSGERCQSLPFLKARVVGRTPPPTAFGSPPAPSPDARVASPTRRSEAGPRAVPRGNGSG